MLTKLLRWPVPDQIKALLEKIDTEGAALDSSSRRKITDLLDEDFLTRYEKLLLKRGLRKYKRDKALDDVMCIVLNQPDERDRASAEYKRHLAASMANTQLVNHLSAHAQMIGVGSGAVPGTAQAQLVNKPPAQAQLVKKPPAHVRMMNNAYPDSRAIYGTLK